MVGTEKRKEMRTKKRCEYCGNEFPFIPYPSRLKSGRGRFCSQKCKGEWQSEFLRGKKSPNWKGGFDEKKYGKKYWVEHKEKLKVQQKERHLTHPEKRKEYNLKNREHRIKQSKEWNQKHPKRVKATKRKWALKYPEKIRLANERRRRNFGFISLNKHFVGSAGHHVDKTYVIYIPKKMHEDNRHSVLKNRNMDKINSLAFGFLLSNSKQWRKFYG